MSVLEIGCCCAYCKTCRAFRDKHCRGCKLDYDTGQRDLDRAKCKIKVCCLRERQLQTCTDCEDFPSCALLQTWYNKAGGKYGRYKKSANYIRKHGYEAFVAIADEWKDASGRLEPRSP